METSSTYRKRQQNSEAPCNYRGQSDRKFVAVKTPEPVQLASFFDIMIEPEHIREQHLLIVVDLMSAVESTRESIRAKTS